MFTTKRVIVALFALLATALVLVACGTPQTVYVTQEIPGKEVIVTQIVEVPGAEKTVIETQIVTVIETQVFTETVVEKVEAFTTPHPLLGDLRFRQALAYCTNKLELVQSVYPLLSPEEQEALVLDSFMSRTSWAYAGAENLTQYPFDPEKGIALLAEMGWSEGFNEAGEALLLRFTTTTAAFRQTWAAVWADQMKACGITVIRLHVPASWWFGDTTGLQVRDFELGAYAWVGQAEPAGRTLYACDQIPLPSNNWVGQNYPGWCNEVGDKAIKNATNSLLQSERAAQYAIVQQEWTKDLPTIPLFNRTETYGIAAGFEGFEPHPGTSYYGWNAYDWAIPGKDTIVVGWVQEPASLFTLVESAQVANAAEAYITGFSTTDQDFSFQARMLKQLSTVDSGLALNNDVEVKEGDAIVNANGDPAVLAVGDKIKDTEGNEVEFTGGTAMMKQLVVTYEWVDGLTFSDGVPLKQADFELAYKINCDPESGATSFITCDNIASVEFLGDTSYKVTWKPGVQDPTYFLPPFGFYASHRVIESENAYTGMTLADVPAKDWATLAEVAEMPIGVGPYMLVEWVKGEKMVYAANPYFYLGAPKTANLIIQIITAENAESQLVNGQVDLLDGTVLAGVSDFLAQAETDGFINVIVEPSGTWEHIDLNMFVK